MSSVSQGTEDEGRPGAAPEWRTPHPGDVAAYAEVLDIRSAAANLRPGDGEDRERGEAREQEIFWVTRAQVALELMARYPYDDQSRALAYAEDCAVGRGMDDMDLVEAASWLIDNSCPVYRHGER